MQEKISPERLKFLMEEGLIVTMHNRTFVKLPFWYEVVDEEKSIVDHFNLKDLPDNIVRELGNALASMDGVSAPTVPNDLDNNPNFIPLGHGGYMSIPKGNIKDADNLPHVKWDNSK